MKAGLLGGISLGGAVLVGALVACGSSDSVFIDGSGDGGDPGTSSSSGESSSSGFGGDGGGSSSGNGGDAGLNACATDKQQAKLSPLDLFVMQDTSGSMWAYTAGTTTKWDSVKQALGAFMTDPGSAGIGIGMQFFPLFANGVPNSCTTNAECNGGVCQYKACAGPGGKFCESNADCNGNAQCTLLGRCQDSPESLCFPGTTCIGAGSCNRPIVRGACDNRQISCVAANYGTPAVPIADLPGAATAINAALAARIPNGQTPTLAALTGAIDAARAHANANAGRVVSVVLSTDGIPFTNGTCDDAVASITAAAAAGVNGSPSIKTFVIGVLSPSDVAQGTPTLNQIAAAGGTGQATILGTSATTVTDFIAALQKVRGASLPCEVALPVPTTGTPDYAKVNVVYTDSKTKNASIVGYVGDAASCDPVKGGWYYDVKPDAGKPTKVILCQATCAAVQGDPAGSLDVVQGCETKTQDPPR